MKVKNDTISRLAMYFPGKHYDEEKYGKESKDNWAGWHRDFGVLTGLAHPMYFKENGEQVGGIKSALLIKDRQGTIHELEYDEDEIVIQSGDCAFIQTGGCIISTPHCVKIIEGIPDDVFRIQFVTFFEPAYETVVSLPQGVDQQKIFEKDPMGMKYMMTKWNGDTTYEKMIERAYNKYYGKDEKDKPSS